MIPSCDGVCSELEPLVPVVEENGERKMKLEFNVKDYKPEEVKVKMLGNNTLQVRCTHVSFDRFYRVVLACTICLYS